MLFKKFTFAAIVKLTQPAGTRQRSICMLTFTAMDSVRQLKIARLLQKELATIFQVESRNFFAGRMITVTVVRVTPDLAQAKVYLSVFPHKTDEDVISEVMQHYKSIRNTLGRNIRHQVRVIPELAFYIDDSIDYLERIDELLKK